MSGVKKNKLARFLSPAKKVVLNFVQNNLIFHNSKPSKELILLEKLEKQFSEIEKSVYYLANQMATQEEQIVSLNSNIEELIHMIDMSEENEFEENEFEKDNIVDITDLTSFSSHENEFTTNVDDIIVEDNKVYVPVSKKFLN